MGLKQYFRHSKRVTSSRRWKSLRIEALRRDGFRCVSCGISGRLEVDHIKPVRDAPELSFVLSNLQALCRSCHSRKTAHEIGLKPPNPARQKWRALVSELETQSKQRKNTC